MSLHFSVPLLIDFKVRQDMRVRDRGEEKEEDVHQVH